MITKNDLKVIKECLAASGVKNSEFEQLNSVPKDDDAYIALVYKGRNYKIKVSDLKFVSKIICGDEIFVPDELGSLTLNLNNTGTSIIAVKFSGSNFPNASTVLIEEGDYFYHSYSNTLHRWNKGWQITPMIPGFYYMYNGGRETLYIYIEGIGLKEVAKDKQDKLISEQNIKTINGLPILGAGNILIETGGEASTSNLEYVVIRDVSMVPRDEVMHSLYTETDGEIVYGKYTRCFLLHSTHDDKMYDSWVQGSFHPSSEAVQGAKFAVWVSPEGTFAMYYIDEDGYLKESTPPGTRFAYLSHWVEDRSELGGGYPNDYAICGRELLKLDYDSMWQTIVPDPLEWGWEGINPAQYDRWVFLYEGDLYYYELGFPPRKMMEGAASVTNTVTTLLSRVSSNENNITDLLLNITRVNKHVVNPLLVKGIVTDNISPNSALYTGTTGDLYYMNNNNYKGFVWRVSNVYYNNWDYGNGDFLSSEALSAANISVIYTFNGDHLYIYKIIENGLQEIYAAGNVTVDSTLNVGSDNPVKNSTIAIQFREIEEEKQDRLISGTNIKSINGTSLLGEGNIKIEASNSIVFIAYAGESADGYGGTWLKDQIYYDTSTDYAAFFKCDVSYSPPTTPIVIPDGTILYIELPNAAFYYYEAGELIPFQKDVLIDNDISLNSDNPVKNRVIATRVIQLLNQINEIVRAGRGLLPIDGVMPSGYIYDIEMEDAGFEFPTPVQYTGEGGVLMLDPGSASTAPKVVLLVEHTETTEGDGGTTVTEVSLKYYKLWTATNDRYSSDVYLITSASNPLFTWIADGLIHIGMTDGMGNTIESSTPIDTGLNTGSARPVANYAVTNAINALNSNVSALTTKVNNTENSGITKSTPVLHFDGFAYSGDMHGVSNTQYTGEGGRIVLNRTVPRFELQVPGELVNTHYLSWTETATRPASTAYTQLRNKLFWTLVVDNPNEADPGISLDDATLENPGRLSVFYCPTGSYLYEVLPTALVNQLEDLTTLVEQLLISNTSLLDRVAALEERLDDGSPRF